MPADLDALVEEIRACRVCALPHPPRPIVWVHPDARILIAGQAPGRLVHEAGVPWNDPSGDRLRAWMGLDRIAFYRRDHIAVAAMGFCFPGTVKGADLPPRRECAPLWRPRLLPNAARHSSYALGGRLCATLSSRSGGQADAWGDGAGLARLSRECPTFAPSLLAE